MKIQRIYLLLRVALLAGLVGSLSLGESTTAPASAQPGNEAFVPEEVVVKLRPGVDLHTLALDYALDPTPIDRFGNRDIYRMRIKDGVTPPARAHQLTYDPVGRVQFAEPNYLGQTPESIGRLIWAHGGGPGQYKGQWASDQIRLQQAHAITRGAGIVVAVLDTGVDRHHPALAGRLLNGYDFVDLDDDPSEAGEYQRDLGFGHGTHVAGLIALTAPDAKILPVRVLDKDGAGNIWVLAEGLAYAANPDGNPATDDGAHVINLSLGTLRKTNLLAELVASLTNGDDDDDAPESPGEPGPPPPLPPPDDDDDDDDDDDGDDDDGFNGTMISAPPRPIRRGIVVVAAAGNRASELFEYPAAEDVAGLLSVGASTIDQTVAAFSNRGWWVQIAAPGENVLSTVPGGGYGSWSGTSMAAPLVAGEAALIRARNPHFSPAEVAQRVRDFSAPLAGSIPRRIDCAAALGL